MARHYTVRAAAPAMRGAGTPRSGRRRVMLPRNGVAGRLLLLGRRGVAGEAGGNIEQPLAQGLADAGKNLRGDLETLRQRLLDVSTGLPGDRKSTRLNSSH